MFWTGIIQDEVVTHWLECRLKSILRYKHKKRWGHRTDYLENQSKPFLSPLEQNSNLTTLDGAHKPSLEKREDFLTFASFYRACS